MIQLPEKPWEKDDTFTVEETGVVFTFDGESGLPPTVKSLTATCTPPKHLSIKWKAPAFSAMRL